LAILEKEIWVRCGLKTDKYYELLGYHIPRRKNNQGRLTVPPNTKILISVSDLPKNSNVKVTKICDDCNEVIKNQSYSKIISSRQAGDGIDRCRRCGSIKAEITKREIMSYEHTLEYWVKENNKNYILLEFSNKNDCTPDKIFKSSGIKYKWNCLLCKSEYSMTIANKVNGNNCPYCTGKKVNHTNCLWATNPDVASLLSDPRIGYEVSKGSQRKLRFTCPKCSNSEMKFIDNVVNQGFSCSRCSDGFSYPEKFVIGIFMQLNMEFETQKIFSWSKNVKLKDEDIVGYKRYDFYIPDLNMIIETHGLQHYEEGFKGGSLIEVKKNDKLKKELAKENGIANYIVLDCRYSNIDWIKVGILNSDIINLINFSNIEWLKCHEFACSTLVKDASDLWNMGVRCSLKISKTLNIGRNTAIKFLKQGAKIGWCDYDSKKNTGALIKSKEIVQLTHDGRFIKSWESMGKARKHLNMKSANGISLVCQGRRKSAGGYRWMYKEDYDQIG